jgi:hypothetical protein
VVSERLDRLVEVISLAQDTPSAAAADQSTAALPHGDRHWNQPGQRAVVLGMTPEITVLEDLVHLNGVLSAPLVLSGYDVPAIPHGAGGAGAPGALPAGSTAELSHNR